MQRSVIAYGYEVFGPSTERQCMKAATGDGKVSSGAYYKYSCWARTSTCDPHAYSRHNG